MLSIQRGIGNIWEFNVKLLRGLVFACKKKGFMSVLDNTIRAFQATELSERLHTTSQKVPCTPDPILKNIV